jgi:small-conductance mechanosensitive channel
VTFLLALLTNAGVNITAFVASLGIGGIAVALALQNILGDLFASVAIGLDKPFEPGEFIAFGADMGTVRHVGVKSTRIASLSGEQLAVSNSQLLNQLIHNYSRMPERRVVFGFTVPYDTTREQLREITERTNAVIEAAQPVRFDRGHFTGFGADGFTFEFVYYMLDSSYTLYRDVQQRINHEIMDVLDSLGVRFAVPARAVTLGRPAGE